MQSELLARTMPDFNSPALGLSGWIWVLSNLLIFCGKKLGEESRKYVIRGRKNYAEPGIYQVFKAALSASV